MTDSRDTTARPASSVSPAAAAAPDPGRVSALLETVCQTERSLAYTLLTGALSPGVATLFALREMFQRLGDIGDKYFLKHLIARYGGATTAVNEASAALDIMAIDEVIPTLKRIYRALSTDPFSAYTGDHLPRMEIGTQLARLIAPDAPRVRSALAHLRRALLVHLGRSTRLALEFPDATVAPFLHWARHCSTEMLARAQALGEEVFRHAVSSAESVVIVGRTEGTSELRLYAEPEVFQRFVTDFLDRVATMALSRHGIVEHISPDGFCICFPQGVKIADHPLKAAFEFVRLAMVGTRDTIYRWSRELRFRPLTHIDPETLDRVIDRERDGNAPPSHTPPDTVPRGLGVSIGMDIGPVTYQHHLGQFLVSGATVERARRCAVGGAGTVVVNSALRWMVMRERRDPTSPLYFEDYPLIFREHPIHTGDGNDFLAWDVLETPEAANSLAMLGEDHVSEKRPTPQLPDLGAGQMFGGADTSRIMNTRGLTGRTPRES